MGQSSCERPKSTQVPAWTHTACSAPLTAVVLSGPERAGATQATSGTTHHRDEELGLGYSLAPLCCACSAQLPCPCRSLPLLTPGLSYSTAGEGPSPSSSVIHEPPREKLPYLPGLAQQGLASQQSTGLLLSQQACVLMCECRWTHTCMYTCSVGIYAHDM